MFKTGYYFLKTGKRYSLSAIASSIWLQCFPGDLEHVPVCGRSPAGHPYFSYYGVNNVEMLVVEGANRVPDSHYADRYTGTSFVIKVGDKEKDRLIDIIDKLVTKKGI